MNMPTGVSGAVRIYIADRAVGGTSDYSWFDISMYVQPGWSISRRADSDALLTFELSNPEGKFSDSTFVDYLPFAEDYPIVLMYGSTVQFNGIVTSPPLRDDSSGSVITVEAASRMAIMRKEDVVGRFFISEYKTVEDVIYTIIYEKSGLHDYYGIEYTRPDAHTKHRLLKDFIFNNKDAHTAITEILEFHKLFLNMDVDDDGVDVITLSRLETANVPLALSTTIDASNIIDLNRERGSEIFYNRVKAIARDGSGNILVAEQQDLDSIQAEGLRVRPTEDIGSVESQSDVQAYAEYLIAKCSRDNYTTQINLDPTKFVETELWALHPLDIVKVSHTKTGLGTNQKYHVEEIVLSGDTTQLTGVQLTLNHSWRNSFVMMFEEFVSMYDEDTTVEDEELVQSRIMTAQLRVRGWWDFTVGVTTHPYPSDATATGGYHGLTDAGKMVIKTNWLKNPEYASGYLPADPLSMRPSKIWPLKANGEVYSKGYWAEHADGWDNQVSFGADGSDYYYETLFEYNITPSQTFPVYGMLVCSRFGGIIDRVDGSYGTQTNKFYLDDVGYLIPGMSIFMMKDVEGATPISYEMKVSYVDYSEGYITTVEAISTSWFTGGKDKWYADCYPVARVLLETSQSFTSGTHCYLCWTLRFYNDNDTYGSSNLSVVTKEGLKNLAYRLEYDIFNEQNGASAATYPPPTFIAIGLNDISTVKTAVDDDDTTLNDEIARGENLGQALSEATTVSDSAKLTAKFSSLQIPPQIVRTTMTHSETANFDVIYVASIEGMSVGDMVFFGTSGGGGYTYSIASLQPNFIKELRGYSSTNSGYGIYLRHPVTQSKNSGTQVTTGKFTERILSSIREIGIFDSEATEHTNTFSYLGQRTGIDNTTAKTVTTEAGGTNGGMGYGDYQYDYLQDDASMIEDSLKKAADADKPPSYFSDQATSTLHYLKGVKGFGYTTIPLCGIKSGIIKDQITFDTDDFYGKASPLSLIAETFKDDSGLSAARSISPATNASYTTVAHKSPKVTLGWLPSKWRIFAAGKFKNKRSFWYNREVARYVPMYAAHLFTFSVSGDVERKDLKNLSLVWRGTAVSWDSDASSYKDGVDFFYWHHGDNQPEWTTSEEGTTTLTGRVGSIRTFDPHWEKLEMYDISGNEHDDTATGVGNSFYTLFSKGSGGDDNKEGINKVGYALSPDHIIYILAVTKYKGDSSSSKVAALTTDFVGLSMATSNILDGEEIWFERGIDYFYDPAWNFIAWPIMDFTWNNATSVYDTGYKLEKITELTQPTTATSTTINVLTPSIPIIGGDILLIRNLTTSEYEIACIAGITNISSGRSFKLSTPLEKTFPKGSYVYRYNMDQSGHKIYSLQKELSPNFPSKNFVNTNLQTVKGRAANLTSGANSTATSLIVTSASGIEDGDVLFINRRQDIDTKNHGGYEWKTAGTPSSDYQTLVLESGIERGNWDDDTCAYDDGSDDTKTKVGIVRYDIPTISSELTLSSKITDVVWSDGDASGYKWKYRNNKWGLNQFSFIEAKLTQPDGLSLSSTTNPYTLTGSTNWTGWDKYGGPGVKIEYIDNTNGKVFVTKANSVTIYDGTSSSDVCTDTTKRVYANLHIDLWDISTTGAMATDDTTTAVFGKEYDSNGNRAAGISTFYTPIMVARNSSIYVHQYSSGALDNTIVYQLSIGEAISSDNENWRMKIKYRCKEAEGTGGDAGKVQTGVKVVGTSGNKIDVKNYYYLDAPMFEHQNIGTYKYHDAYRGNVVFLLDWVCISASWCANIASPAISKGATTFTKAGMTTCYVGDLLCFKSSDDKKMEIVQITAINGNDYTVTPAFINDWTVSDTIYHAFKYGSYNTTGRIVIPASQVYCPIDDDDTVNISSYIYRAANYDLVYAEETGKLLVYSLLKDDSPYRPIYPDRADSVQVIQEVKFKYEEKDMV